MSWPYVNRFGGFVAPGPAPPPPPPPADLTITLTPSNQVVGRTGAGVKTVTVSVAITGTDGTPPYSVAIFPTGADEGIVTRSGAGALSFHVTLANGEVRNGTVDALVTDAAGQGPFASNTVNYTAFSETA